MAIRIRCTGCKKKISVDDAFAGGTCRCPYCKEIVLVGGSPRETNEARPYAPIDRPDAPDEAPRPREAAVPAEALEVPMANPVHIQGVVTIVLMGLIVVMAGGAVWLGVAISRMAGADPNLHSEEGGAVAPPRLPGNGGGERPLPPPSSTMPAPPVNGAAVADVQLTPPVIYVLDCGGSMKNLFDYARYMARVSIRSLKAGQKFSVVLSTEEGEKFLGDDYLPGGQEGDASAREFLLVMPRGSPNIEKALEAAVARGPRTIVLFRRNAIDDPKAVADKARAAGVAIVAVALGSDAGAKESLSALCGPTGGRCQAFSEQGAAAWADRNPLPD